VTRTLLSTKHLGVVCAVSGDVPLDPEDWKDFLCDLHRVEGAEIRVVFRCGEGSPDSHMRRDLFDLTQDRPIHFAIMTASKDAAENWIAAGWMGSVEVRAFAPDRFEAAFDFLDVADAFYPGLERKILSLADQLHTQVDEGPSGVRAKDEGKDAHPDAKRLADDLA